MKHAKIYDKNEFGLSAYVGEAILLNKMDSTHDKGFWEYKFVGSNTTHCDWVANKDVFEG